MLELRVHTNGLPPPSKHGYIWIDLPKGISYERVARASIAGWRKSETVTRAFGDEWLRSLRSCVLFVPSAVVPRPYENVLLNPNHPEFRLITHLTMPKPLKWDPRLFP
jgi:RES domain-containing protein